MALIQCENASFGYEGRPVIRNITMTVEPGAYIGIVGENGAGKSTFVKDLLGLMKPLEGSVSYGPSVERSGIGYLPQQTEVMKNFPATVWEVVLSGCLHQSGLRPFYNRAEKAAARRNMERMGVAPLEKQCFRELSGGQKQRVLIARALCATDSLLVLDEPAAGLDPVAVRELYQLLKKLNEEEGMAILMVSHDLDHVLTQARQILHIKGDARFFGSVSDYQKSAFGAGFTGGVL